MAATDVAFSAFNMNDGVIMITSDVDDSAAWTQNISLYNLARTNGAVLADKQFATKPIVVTGLIKGTSLSNLETNIDAFNAAMGADSGNLDIFFAGATRRYPVIAPDFSVSRPARAALWAKFSVTFTAIDFGADTTTSHLFAANAMNQTKTYSLPMTGSAPVQHPIITITISSATLSTQNTITASNPTTGETLSVTRTFVVADVVVINTETEEVTVNGVVVDYDGAFPSYGSGTQSLILSADFQNTATITSSQTWTSPSGITTALVKAWGGGGSGGNTASNGSAGGGAGGSYIEKTVTIAGATGYAVVIGAGGASSVAGGATTFASTTAIAGGGNPGGGATAGAGGIGTPHTNTGDLIYLGGNGATGGSFGQAGGGGGESGGPSGVGTVGGAFSGATGGIGGTGHANAGDGGAGANLPGSGFSTVGGAGVVPGGGGGGSARNAGSTVNGGTGARGEMWIVYPSFTFSVNIDVVRAFL